VANINTVGNITLRSGDGVNLVFNLTFDTTEDLTGCKMRARLVIKSSKALSKGDTDASIFTTKDKLDYTNKLEFNLSPEETAKLTSKNRYYLALQVSIPDKKLSSEVAYELTVTDSVVSSLL
jgi:hypothetical protein